MAVALAFALLLPGPKVVTMPLALLLGDRLGRFALARAGARRRRAMDAELPQLLDLIAAGSAAGLSAVVGLERAVAGLRGPLGRELRGSLDAVELGSRWRRSSGRWPRGSRSRTSNGRRRPDPNRDARGVPDGRDARPGGRRASARRAAVAERARAAPVKMLFPLVFLVLPAFLLLTVVPVLLTTVQSIR